MNVLRTIFILGLFYTLFFMIFASESRITANLEREIAANESILGESRASLAENFTRNAFESMFVKTKIVDYSFRLFIPTQQQRIESEGIQTLGTPLFVMIDNSMRAGWMLVYQLMLRMAIAFMWWPLILVVLVPFVVDAMAYRKIVSTSFGMTSPHFQGLSVRAIPIVLCLCAIVFLLPVYVSPLLVPFAVFAIGVSSWVAVAQFVKRG